MKTLAIAVLGLGIAAIMQVSAQQTETHRMDDREHRRHERRHTTEPLTDAQREEIKRILSQYDAATLSAEDARAIHKAFREAGLRGGPTRGDIIKEAGFDPDVLRDLAPPPDGRRQRERPEPGDRKQPPRRDVEEQARADRPEDRQPRSQPGQSHRYSIEQAASDRAQLHTIAFSGLAFITGDFGASTFIPPGKVCDYFGFQYMRDIDAAGKGHNPMFLNRVAGNILHILNDEQRGSFEELAAEQAPRFEELARMRFPLIKAFHRELDRDTPEGSAGLNRDAVIRYVGDIFAFDAELSYRRAEVFGQIAASLTDDQKAYLGSMKFGDFNTWPDIDERDKLKRPRRGQSRLYNVAYMTYASEFFSWYAGSVEADTYFCPERHGTYFGGFYMKDMPAMGKRDYDISTTITGNSGETFLTLLSAEQRGDITGIIERQRKALAEMIEVRRAMSVELRNFLAGDSADREKVLALGRRYGELDGEVSWMYATAFARVGQSLTEAQRAELVKLRNLPGYTSAPAYIYSRPIEGKLDLPNTDFLFGAAAR